LNILRIADGLLIFRSRIRGRLLAAKRKPGDHDDKERNR
jgi:hypothetical protein